MIEYFNCSYAITHRQPNLVLQSSNDGSLFYGEDSTHCIPVGSSASLICENSTYRHQ